MYNIIQIYTFAYGFSIRQNLPETQILMYGTILPITAKKKKIYR